MAIITIFRALRSSFHADLQGGDSLSYGSSDDSRVENSDVMSVHSDTTLAATRERLSLAEYALMDEDALSDHSDVRFSRQLSAFSDANQSLQYSQSSGISRSLETVNTISTDHGSTRYHKRLKRVDHPIMGRSNPVAFAKSEKVTNSCYLEVAHRTTSNRKKLSGKNALMRSKSDGASGRSTSSEDDKLHQKRLPSNFRLEIKTLSSIPFEFNANHQLGHHLKPALLVVSQFLYFHSGIQKFAVWIVYEKCCCKFD